MWESSEPEQNEEPSRESDGSRGNGSSGLEVRLLIAEEEAPVLIGKGGSNSKQLREKNGVHLTLSKTSEAAERICTIRGSVTHLAECISQMTELFVKNAAQIHKGRGGVPPGGVSAEQTTMAMLVHESLAGLVIGRRGAVAKTIFTEIKGKIKVSDAPIPYTTDKVAYITGTPEQMRQTMDLVLRHLVGKSPKTDSPVRNYFPEGRATFRYEQNQWPKPSSRGRSPPRDARGYSPPPRDSRGHSPPRNGRGYSPPPRRYSRERSRDRYDARGPADRYSERPSIRSYDDRYDSRDPYDRYDSRGVSPPRADYYPPRSDSYSSSSYTSRDGYAAGRGYPSRPEPYAPPPGGYSQSASASADRASMAPSGGASYGAPPGERQNQDPFARLDALDRRAPGYGVKSEPAAYDSKPRTSWPAGLEARGGMRPGW